MVSFNSYFKGLAFFVFFVFIFFYAYFFSEFVKVTSFVDEEIVIFIAIAFVSYFFLKLNLKELNAGVNSRISLIENDFKKNYKIAIENLITAESIFQKSKNLAGTVQKNFNFFFYDYISTKFNDVEDKFFKELILLPTLYFLKNDFINLIYNVKIYKNSVVEKSFVGWNQKNFFKSSFLVKNLI
jgi:hypothetical protein